MAEIVHNGKWSVFLLILCRPPSRLAIGHQLFRDPWTGRSQGKFGEFEMENSGRLGPRSQKNEILGLDRSPIIGPVPARIFRRWTRNTNFWNSRAYLDRSVPKFWRSVDPSSLIIGSITDHFRLPARATKSAHFCPVVLYRPHLINLFEENEYDSDVYSPLPKHRNASLRERVSSVNSEVTIHDVRRCTITGTWVQLTSTIKWRWHPWWP